MNVINYLHNIFILYNFICSSTRTICCVLTLPRNKNLEDNTRRCFNHRRTDGGF